MSISHDAPKVAATQPAEEAASERSLKDLPKGHLHLHMEAAMRPETLQALSAKLDIEPPTVSGFQGFSAFSGLYKGLLATLHHPGHLDILMDQIFEDQAADGVAYLELSVSPDRYADDYGSTVAALDALVDMARTASRVHGVAFGLMPTIDRTAGPDAGLRVADAAAQLAGRGVVSLGLAADERGYPGIDHRESFALAKEAGLQVTPHAGELVGPESVQEALDVLGADRVLHGVRSVEDPELVARLAGTGVSLDVCPTSNVLLDVVDDIAAHPITALLKAGVRCSINADDPILFGPNILDEYEICRTRIGLSDEQLATCAWSSIDTTLAPTEVKAESKRLIDEWLAS
ncbi:adenosine deaminase [Gordonia sp. DT219]|uniref:adenosine deaminase n=1 Tax=Gordonia sp. DT219 TaxID=3416658 RepID=UPI003CF925A8